MIDRDTIIKMAREVADPNTADVVFDDLITLNFGEIERFAALVAAHEREACAKACEEHPEGLNMLGGHFVLCAKAIRARGET